MADRIQLRHDTATNWTNANPILAIGEFGLESQGTNPETYKLKIGDGLTAWNDINYYVSGSSTLTDEEVQDIIGAMLTDSSTIDFTYNDANGTLTAEVIGKQDTLVSGTNIKTINNESVLGSGNIEISGTSTFLGLTDTPSSFTSDKIVKVNSTGDGLIFDDPSSTSTSWGDIQGTLSNQTDLQNALDGKANVNGDATKIFKANTPAADDDVTNKAYVDQAITDAGGYTDEAAQDAVGGILTDTATIDFTYDDANGQIKADVIKSGLGLTKADVGLGNVDNTSDMDKPVSTATQTALDGKADTNHNHDGAYEPILNNPDVDGKILSSTASGTRSWVAYTPTDNNYTTAEKQKLVSIEENATADQTKADIDALGIDAATVNGHSVNKDVPSDAVFTDTQVALVDNVTSIDTDKALTANQGKMLKGLIDNINTILASDDTTLDELQEIVDYIKQNKSDLESLGISNIAGLQSALDGKLESVVAGDNVTVDNTDPKNPIVSATVPTKTSDLTNDSNFAVDANYVHTDNNYTATDKDKVANLSGVNTGDQDLTPYARLDTENTWTKMQNVAITVDNDGNFDLNTTAWFSCTPSADTQLIFSNIEAGNSGVVFLDNSGGYTITKDATIMSDADFLTTVSTAGKYEIGFKAVSDTEVWVTYSGALS